MLTYDLEARGSLSLYEYLYRRLRDDILSGALAAGERLPSKRALAEHLRVSVVTVEGAYQQLEAEGYVNARPRRGFFCSASISSRGRSHSCLVYSVTEPAAPCSGGASGPLLSASARTSDRSMTLPDGAGPPSMPGITACSVCSGAGGGGPPGASGVALVLVSSAMLANTSLSRFWPHTLAARVQGFSAAYKNTAYCPVRRCFV